MKRVVSLCIVLVLVTAAGCVGTDTRPTGSALDGGPTTTDTTDAFGFTPADRLDARVIDVVDGDTIDVRLPDGSEDTVRLLGVDTPEVHVDNNPAEFEGVPDTDAGRTCLRAAGDAASTALRSQLAGREVTLLIDPTSDRRGGYDRLLAYVVSNGTTVNQELVAAGHARVYDTDFARRDEFEAAEREARAAGRGLWRCQHPA
jgi:micrococcal nuclease